jgi:cell division septal protein FtsQ
VVAVVLFAVKWAKEQKIQSLSVSGNSALHKSDVVGELVDTVVNFPNGKIKLSNLQKLLKQNPMIQETYITHKNLNELKVEIKERRPEALLTLENGELAYIDAELNIIPYQLYNDMPDVPLIRGVFNDGKIDSSGILGALTILNSLTSDSLHYLQTMISEIDYNLANKDFNLISSDDGVLIKLGSIKDLNYKINKLDSYWRKNLVCSNKKLKYIDLRWSNHIITANS